MRKLLHLLTEANDTDANQVIAGQRALPDCELVTIDLEGGRPDYTGLLENVFAADSVTVW